MARAAARQISFADVELMRQGVRLEPLLEAISKFLDNQHEMIERVREGAERFALFVGAALLANNLMIVAALLTKRSPRRRTATR